MNDIDTFFENIQKIGSVNKTVKSAHLHYERIFEDVMGERSQIKPKITIVYSDDNEHLKEFYNAVDHYKTVRKQLGGAAQINAAWHAVLLQLQKVKQLLEK